MSKCKECEYYIPSYNGIKSGSKARCNYEEINLFNNEVEYKGKLSDNNDGRCPNYQVKISLLKWLFGKRVL